MCQWENICFWLTADAHLFEQNKERVTLTYRFTFHSNKRSSWHATHQRGVIHRCERKEARDGCIQKDWFTCVNFCNFFFSFFLFSATSQQLKLVRTEPKWAQTFNETCVTCTTMASFLPAKRNFWPRKVRDEEEQFANINKPISLISLRRNQRRPSHSRTDLFILTNIYSPVWDHRDGAVITGLIFLQRWKSIWVWKHLICASALHIQTLPVQVYMYLITAGGVNWMSALKCSTPNKEIIKYSIKYLESPVHK